MPRSNQQRGELTPAALRLLQLLPTESEFATAEEITRLASESGWTLEPGALAALLRNLRRHGMVIARRDGDNPTWSATPTGVARRAA